MMNGQMSLFDVAADRAMEAAQQPVEVRPESQHHDYPRYALCRGQRCRVLYYEGEGYFRLLTNDDHQFSAHRAIMTFLPEKKVKCDAD